MVTISDLSLSPTVIRCGDSVEIKATVTFDGKPRPVSIIVEVQNPCRFHGATRQIEITRDGPSPQVFRVVDTITCRAGERFDPRITATASDGDGRESRVFTRLEVSC